MNNNISIFSVSLTSLRLAVLVFLVFGLLYSLLGVGIGQVLAPGKANGSLIVQNKQAQGSELVGQTFTDPKYFTGRPSAAKNDPMAVAGSNMARSNPELQSLIALREAELRERLGLMADQPVPSDLLTASGSGIDPHISPQSALIQVKSVAGARGVSEDVVQQLVEQHTEQPQFGILGQARVNVLQLNRALDSMNPS